MMMYSVMAAFAAVGQAAAGTCGPCVAGAVVCNPCTPVTVKQAAKKEKCKSIKIGKRKLFNHREKVTTCVDECGATTVIKPTIVQQAQACSNQCTTASCIPCVTSTPVKVIQPIVIQPPKPVVTCQTVCTTPACTPCQPAVAPCATQSGCTQTTQTAQPAATNSKTTIVVSETNGEPAKIAVSTGNAVIA